MFECIVGVELPLYNPQTKEPISFRIAQYDFDPGLQVNDLVLLEEVTFSQKFNKETGERLKTIGRRFSFEAIVKKRNKIISSEIEVGNQIQDRLILWIVLEMADKEQLGDIAKELKERGFDLSDKEN